jgi:hypothetical protein
MKRGQTGVTQPIPPTVTSMGRLFLFREVRPRADVPSDLGFREAKGLARLSDNNPPHKTPPDQKVLDEQPIKMKENQK